MAGIKIFGVEFAPLWIPFERRIQTFAAFFLPFSIAFGTPVGWSITFYLLIYGNLLARLLMIAYLIYIYFDDDARFKGSWSKSIVNAFRSSKFWQHFCNYFPIKLVKTADLDPSRNYLFGYFPHGMMAFGAGGGVATNGAHIDKLFPHHDFHMVTLNQHFKAPFFREYLFFFGSRSCDAKCIEYNLSTKSEDGRGRVVLIAVDGAAGAFVSRPGTYKILLKKRKGFVKVALKSGAPLVPVFSFGETDLFDQVDNPKGSTLRSVQEFFKKYTGFAPAIPVGRGFFQYSFGLIAQRRPMFVVFGTPMEVPKIEKPTTEDVDKYHAIFTENLINLFETHKSKYVKHPEQVSLELVD